MSGKVKQYTVHKWNKDGSIGAQVFSESMTMGQLHEVGMKTGYRVSFTNGKNHLAIVNRKNEADRLIGVPEGAEKSVIIPV